MGWQTGIPSILEIAGAPAAIFIYSPSPGAGNLIGSWSSTAGTDQYGNAFPEGIFIAAGEITGPITVEIGMAGGSQISLLPGIDSQFNVTSVISGIMQAAMQLSTTDANETVPGNIGSVILGSGTSAKMATVIGSPVGSGSAAYLVLESQNDGGTDNPVVTIGTVTSPDTGATLVFTPVLTTGPNYLLLYSGSGGSQVVVTKTSGSGSIAIPASAISPGYGEAWGAGASSAGQSAGVTTAMGGDGGGGYSAESTFPITPGGSVTYSVPASSNAPGGSPADCTLNNGLGLIVTAHSGQAGTGSSLGAGGPTSANTISFAGGSGGARSTHTPNAGGGGGGGGAGPGGAGNHGNGGSPTAGGNGGAGASGSGNGGQGGAPNSNASAGAAPGGGGGGGGSDADGAIGGAGKVRLTYHTGTPGIMLSVASAAGTDQFGTAYKEGIHFTDPIDTNTYSIGTIRQTSTSTQTISSITPVALTGISIPLGVGTYTYLAEVPFSEVAANDAYVVIGFSGSGSIQGLVNYQNNSIVKAQTAFSNTGLNSAALAAGTYMARLTGTVTITGAGSMIISLAASAAAATYTLIAGSYLEVKRL